MPKLRRVSGQEAVRALERLGFVHMPVDSPAIRNDAQIVYLDSRTKQFGERKFPVMLFDGVATSQKTEEK